MQNASSCNFFPNIFLETTKITTAWDIWRSLYDWLSSLFLVIGFVFTFTDTKSIY